MQSILREILSKFLIFVVFLLLDFENFKGNVGYLVRE